MRIFIALGLPSEVITLCLSLQKQIRAYCIRHNGGLEGVQFIKPEWLHITLKAPMELDENQIEQAQQSLMNLSLPPLKICTTTVQTFIRNQEFLWLGVEGEGLREYAFHCNEAVKPLGFISDFVAYPEFKGHITLVRGVHLETMSELLGTVNDGISPHCFIAEEILIKESVRADGRIMDYLDRAVVSLG
jgi:2'-5' RNA ligase